MELRAVAAAFFIAIALPATGWGEERYEVKITRPSKVGQVCDFTTMLHRHAVAQTIEKPKGRFVVDRVLEISGRQTVLEIAGIGLARIKVVIDTCTLNGDKLIEKGATLAVDFRPPGAKFLINDKVPDKETEKSLAELFPVEKDGVPDAEEIFGHTGKVTPGDSWSVRADMLQKRLEAEGFPVDRDSISGSVFCGRPQQLNDVPCLRVTSSWFAEARESQVQQLHIVGGSCSQLTSSLLPTDPNAPGPLTTHVESKMQTFARGVSLDGTPETTRFQSGETVDTKIAYISPK